MKHILSLICLAFIGCESTKLKGPTDASGGSELPSFDYLYVANMDRNSVLTYRIVQDGSLIPLRETPVQGAGPFALAHDRAGRLLVVLNFNNSTIKIFEIQPTTGELRLTQSLNTGTRPVSASFDLTENFLFVANYGIDGLTTYRRVTETTFVLHSITPTGDSPHTVLVDPTNQFVYVPNAGHGIPNPAIRPSEISQFQFDSQLGDIQSLTPPVLTIPQIDSQPRVIINGLTQGHAYCIDENGPHISHLERDSSGALHLLSQVTIGVAGADLKIQGRFLYATSRVDHMIRVFLIDPDTGDLSIVQTLSTEGEGQSIALAPSGNALYVVNRVSSPSLKVFSINSADGTLQLDTRNISDPSLPLGTPMFAVAVRTSE